MSAQPTSNETQVQTTDQTNQAPTQQGTNVVFGQPNAQGVVFYQIIDLVTEVQRGNFLPALHSLRYELIPKDFIDHTGYNFLHYATSQNQLPIVLILLDHFKFDVNIRSGTNQTALMIACHYGNVELIRVLLERGALVNVQDDTKFSPLLYSIKAKHVPQVFYLLHHNESIHEVDANGCSAIHWAAYTNNVFFLQVLNRLGLNLQTTDGTGLTPLERAIQGESFQAIEYLVDRVHTSLPASLKIDEIKNNDIKIIINRKFFPSALEKFQDSAVLFFRRRSRALTFITYFLLWLLAMIFYRQEVMHKGFGYTIDLVYFITSLYFIGFSYFYIMKSAGGPPKKFSYESLNMSTESDESLTSTASSLHRVMDSAPKQNFDALDKLIQGPHAATVIHDESANQNQGFASFLHEIAWLFEVKNYKELQKFDTRAFCAECLTRKNPRSAHPKESRTCIDNFHHYSYCLGRSVDSSNHMHYVLMLTVQTVQFTLMIFGIWAAYWEEVKHGNLVAFEVGYLVGHKHGAFNAIIYWFFLVLSSYNLIFFLIEIYGICKNLTWYEIFNTPDCTYLHQVKQDARGQVVKSYHNPFDKGIVKNVFSYFQRIIQH